MSVLFNKTIKRIILQKCPNCGVGDVFHKGAYFAPQIPKMHKRCSACSYNFRREPGYFFGATYVSYGLGVLEGIAAFLLVTFSFPTLTTLSEVGAVIITLFLFAKLNFTLSRIIWLNIFP